MSGPLHISLVASNSFQRYAFRTGALRSVGLHHRMVKHMCPTPSQGSFRVYLSSAAALTSIFLFPERQRSRFASSPTENASLLGCLPRTAQKRSGPPTAGAARRSESLAPHHKTHHTLYQDMQKMPIRLPLDLR